MWEQFKVLRKSRVKIKWPKWMMTTKHSCWCLRVFVCFRGFLKQTIHFRLESVSGLKGLDFYAGKTFCLYFWFCCYFPHGETAIHVFLILNKHKHEEPFAFFTPLQPQLKFFHNFSFMNVFSKENIFPFPSKCLGRTWQVCFTFPKKNSTTHLVYIWKKVSPVCSLL